MTPFLSSGSSGSSLTRRGRHTECSRSAADSAIAAARNDAENTIPVCARGNLSLACARAPYAVVSVSASPGRHRAPPLQPPPPPPPPRRFVPRAFSAPRIVANRAGLRSPNPPISSSNERIISRSAAFSRTFPQPAQFHARLTPSCLYLPGYVCDTRNVFDTQWHRIPA
jgi:hypothetical protein